MIEDAAVFGGQKNMFDGLENAKALYKPDMIMRSRPPAWPKSSATTSTPSSAMPAEGRPRSGGLSGSVCPHPELRRLPHHRMGQHVRRHRSATSPSIIWRTRKLARTAKSTSCRASRPTSATTGSSTAMMQEMGVDYSFLCDPSEVLDTPADGDLPDVFRRHHARRGQGRTERHRHDAPAALATGQDPQIHQERPGNMRPRR